MIVQVGCLGQPQEIDVLFVDRSNSEFFAVEPATLGASRRLHSNTVRVVLLASLKGWRSLFASDALLLPSQALAEKPRLQILRIYQNNIMLYLILRLFPAQK